MIEIGFDVLRVIGVTVETFAVVFPDEFPIGFDEVIDGFGDFGAAKALRFRDAEDFLRGVELKPGDAESRMIGVIGSGDASAEHPQSITNESES